MRVGDDPVRRKIDERSGGQAEAIRQQREVPSVVPVEVVEQQVRRREDRSEQPEDERHHEEGNDDDEGKDGQRRAHQEPDENDGRDLGGAERTGGCDGRLRDVLLDPLAGRERLVAVRRAQGFDLLGRGHVVSLRRHGPARVRVGAASSP